MRHNAPEVGEFAYFTDRQGAVLAMIQLARDTGAYPREKAENHLSWSELHTTDPKDALAFHTALFGWRHEAWGPDYFMVGDEHADGIMAGQPGVPPHWLVYVNTADADGTAAKVAALGGRVIVAPQDLAHVGRFGVFQDP